MTDVTLESNAVTVHFGTFDAPSGGGTLTTLNRLTKVTGTGVVGMATIAESITGVLTIAKTGTTARTVTVPDAAITVAGINYAQSWTADQTLTDVNLVLSATTGTKIGTAVGQKLGFWGVTPVVQPSGAAQVAPASYATGAFGLDSDAKMQALYNLVVAMRTALVAAGIMKGAA